MANIDYDACYCALNLTPGATVKQVNEAWRRLSRIHHPDQHVANPSSHKQALEKQKQINNARDNLKKWFEQNPSIPPPRTLSASHRTKSEAGSQSRSPGGGTHAESKGTTGSATCGGTRQGSTRSGHYDFHHQPPPKGYSTRQGQTASKKSKEPETGWFPATDLRFSSLQALLRKLGCEQQNSSSDQSAILGFVLGIGAVFGPMWIIASIIRFLFPDVGREFPDWLQMLILGSSVYCTILLFRWFFAETEIIKLQEKVFYFRTARTPSNVIEYLKIVLGKNTQPNFQWNLSQEGHCHNAVLEYQEQILPDWKEKRELVIRFAAKPASAGAVVALEIRAKSPVNSFSCNRIARAIIEDLRKELQEISA
ncbi:MAG TPA: DnaJ domain-containing protein [Candidatus Obscuribacterales bacterium]